MTRFTLRDVFWLTLVVGIGVGWWVDHSRIWTIQTEHWLMKRAIDREGLVVDGDNLGPILLYEDGVTGSMRPPRKPR